MDDEGGSPHLSMSVIFGEKKYFHKIPLLTTGSENTARWCKTDMP
ncbi:MAG TPA: hypothetical protein VJ959_06305 [Desulfotignum sp.]|nr:hypothetical protein [Desulfotignum sp.]